MPEKKTTDAQLRAVKKYREKLKRLTVDFYPSEEEIWNHVQSQKNKQGYIKDLIRADIEKESNMYTVKELLEALQKCPGDYTVMVNYDVHVWGDIEEVGIDHAEKTVDLFTD